MGPCAYLLHIAHTSGQYCTPQFYERISTAMDFTDFDGPVGMLPASTYRQGYIAVSTGDLAVLYSDGVVEAMNASEEESGEDRLRTVISENSARSLAEIRDITLKQVRSFLGEEQLQDDLTFVVAWIR